MAIWILDLGAADDRRWDIESLLACTICFSLVLVSLNLLAIWILDLGVADDRPWDIESLLVCTKKVKKKGKCTEEKNRKHIDGKSKIGKIKFFPFYATRYL